MSNCTTGCRTQDHATYGECLASKQPQSRNSTASRDRLYRINQLNEREIREYRAARAQGIQPKGTKLSDTRMAVALSQASDTAVRMT